MNGLTSNNAKIRKKLEWYDISCPYRSMSGTGTGISGVFLLVWVPSMDLYEHSDYSRVYSLAESSSFFGILEPRT